jgi:molecular chaperone GrpE (heat shock protein)
MNPFKQNTRTTTIAPETTTGRTGPGTAKIGTPAVASEPLALADRAVGLISAGVLDAVAVVRAALAVNALDHRRIELIEATSRRELPERIARLETRLEGIQTGVDALRAELAGLGSRLAQSVNRLATSAQNLDQLRLMIEKLTSKTEELSSEFIERQVSDPLYREFARFHGLLRALAANGAENWRTEVDALATAMAQFLDYCGLNLIEPQPGDDFDPRLHQPLEYRPTGQAAQQGKICGTLRVGMRRNGRLIQPARVKIFVACTDPENQNQNQQLS